MLKWIFGRLGVSLGVLECIGVLRLTGLFPCQENHSITGATVKGKNMLPIGSIFFPLRVVLIRIEYNFKGF